MILGKKKILIAVLNWGLGHATRCIPLIRQMEHYGFLPVIASDGPALSLLQETFPHLVSYRLPSYNITYSKNAIPLKYHLLLRCPRLIEAFSAERKAVRDIVSKERIDALISDNRPGARSKNIPSVYLTHQIKVLSGSTSYISSSIHSYLINKFDQCWVPDITGNGNLSGEMSEDHTLDIPVRFLGISSRLRKEKLEIKYQLTVLLSGPEPQREILEKILLKTFKDYPGKILFIRGKKDPEPMISANNRIEIIDFLTGHKLEEALNRSAAIVSRPGFSTLCDLAVLEKKAFFIPTPGQYEQEYLAERMRAFGISPYCRQEDFSLKKLAEMEKFSGFKGFENSTPSQALFEFFKGK